MGLLYYTNEYEPEVCEQLNKPLKKLYIVVLVLLILASYCVTSWVVAFSRFRNFELIKNFDYSRALELREQFVNELAVTDEAEMTRADIKREVKDLVGAKAYILIDMRPWRAGAAGGTVIPTRLILVDPNQDNEHYAITLCHELIHLTSFTSNEGYTQFETFKKLYTSDNLFLHRAALTLWIETFDRLYPENYYFIGNSLEFLDSLEV